MLVYYWVVPGQHQLEWILLDMENMRQRHKSIQRPSLLFFTPALKQFNRSLILQDVDQDKSFILFDLLSWENGGKAKYSLSTSFSSSNLLTDLFLFLQAPLLWLNKIRVQLSVPHLVQWSEEWMNVWTVEWSLWRLLLNLLWEETLEPQWHFLHSVRGDWELEIAP